MGAKVICTCPKCIVHWVIVDGQKIPGNKISTQLRRQHEISATASRSPDFATRPSPLGVKDFLDEEDDEVYGLGKPKSSRGVWTYFS
jgi:hypothetical protein